MFTSRLGRQYFKSYPIVIVNNIVFSKIEKILIVSLSFNAKYYFYNFILSLN